LIHGIDQAERDGAPFVVIGVDTPGGLLTSTRQIVQRMLASRVPVVVYVWPQGAHAGSAGALLTLAADIAVMAPGTNIGAAHPVSGSGERMEKEMREKLVNDTTAFAQGLAKAHGRSTEVAAKFVRESTSLTADEALKQNIVDFLAESPADLMRQLTGFKPKVARNGVAALPAETFELAPVAPNVQERLTAFFADPNLAYLILSIGALCLWIELTHPGLV
jgi:membrane-bound serine protease (ClpP class)